jgi:putative ABC transport system ATP-binding protein
MLCLDNISYSYTLSKRQIPVLKALSYTFDSGSFTSIQAPSGSGKTTLLNLLGLLDRPSEGKYFVDTMDTSEMSDNEKSLLRATLFGFLFQNFRLIPNKTVLDNICLGIDIAGIKSKHQQEQWAWEALEQVGLSDRARHLPPELSGGEAQRIAFARALAKRPRVLLADEPTGNLDLANRDKLLDLISMLHAEGKTIIMVTHDSDAAARAEKIVYLADFRLRTETLAQAHIAAEVR